MVKVAILGAGFSGKIHANAYKKSTYAKIEYIFDNNKNAAESLAKEVGGEAVTDFKRILDDPSIKLIDVCLPTPFHPEYAIRALEAGKHVVVEKPLALSIQEVDSILKTGERMGKFVMVAHVLRFWPEYEAIYKIIKSKRLGKPLFASAQRLSNPPQWSNWFQDQKLSGGVVLDLSIHDLDIMNWFFGRPRNIFSRGVKLQGESWGHVIIEIDYESCLATVESSFIMPKEFPFTAGLRVLCEKGVIEYMFRAGGASIEQGHPAQYLIIHEAGKPNQPILFEKGDAFEREIACFLNCVNSGKPQSNVTPEQARLAVQTSLLARQSLDIGKTLNFPKE